MNVDYLLSLVFMVLPLLLVGIAPPMSLMFVESDLILFSVRTSPAVCFAVE